MALGFGVGVLGAICVDEEVGLGIALPLGCMGPRDVLIGPLLLGSVRPGRNALAATMHAFDALLLVGLRGPWVLLVDGEGSWLGEGHGAEDDGGDGVGE